MNDNNTYYFNEDDREGFLTKLLNTTYESSFPDSFTCKNQPWVFQNEIMPWICNSLGKYYLSWNDNLVSNCNNFDYNFINFKTITDIVLIFILILIIVLVYMYYLRYTNRKKNEKTELYKYFENKQ